MRRHLCLYQKEIPPEKRGMAIMLDLALRKLRLRREMRKLRAGPPYAHRVEQLQHCRDAENEIHNALECAKMIYYNGELR